MLSLISSLWHWALIALAVLIVADAALVLWRNWSAIKVAYYGSPSTNGMLALPALGLLGTLWDISKTFLNIGQTTVTHTTGIVGAAIGAVPAFLKALSNPVAAALVFLLVGAGGGYMYQPDRVRVAIDRANRSADIAIAKAVKLANERADQAITKHVAEYKCPAPKPAAAPATKPKKR